MYCLVKKDGIRIRSNTISLLGIPTQDDTFSFVSMALSVVSSPIMPSLGQMHHDCTSVVLSYLLSL